MSSAHFPLLPPLALQLAIQVDAYCAALRLLAADPRDAQRLAAVAGSLEVARELARSLPALWVEWGRCVVAHADFTLLRMGDAAAPALRAKLLAVEACADALMRRAVHWAVLEQGDAKIPVEVAQAFIEWEAARKVLFALRQGALASAGGPQPADASGDPEHADELRRQWEGKCQALLAHATLLLGAGPAAPR